MRTPLSTSPAIVQTRIPSPWGEVCLAASPVGLVGLWFVERQRYLPDAVAGTHAWQQADDHPLLSEAAAQWQAYCCRGRTTFDLPLDLATGTSFQQNVWRALQSIPYGQTTSYGLLSANLGRPTAVRAVAAAIGHNPLSIILPCHRVLGRDGSLTGYAGGVDRKIALLRHEGVAL